MKNTREEIIKIAQDIRGVLAYNIHKLVLLNKFTKRSERLLEDISESMSICTNDEDIQYLHDKVESSVSVGYFVTSNTDSECLNLLERVLKLEDDIQFEILGCSFIESDYGLIEALDNIDYVELGSSPEETFENFVEHLKDYIRCQGECPLANFIFFCEKLDKEHEAQIAFNESIGIDNSEVFYCDTNGECGTIKQEDLFDMLNKFFEDNC